MNAKSESICAMKTEIADHGRVSVIMPNYNGAEFIGDAIDSVLSQTYENFELIVVDDHSADGSAEIVLSYGDDRIRLLRNEDNKGAAQTRNKGIEAATGRWIAFLDNDDVWLPTKLEEHLSFMTSRNSVLSFTDYSVVSESGDEICAYAPRGDEFGYKSILKHNSIGCSTVIYDADSLGKVYMPEVAVKREDHACWLGILRNGSVASCYHAPLTTYRLRANSVSAKKTKMIKYQWRVYRKSEGLGLFASLFYLGCWAINGVLKYR